MGDSQVELRVKVTGQDAVTPMLGKVGGSLRGLGSAIGSLGILPVMGVAAATTALVSFGKASIDAASDAAESTNKMHVVFGAASGQIASFAQGAARNLGMSSQAATEAAGTFGNLFTSMGIGVGPAADMSRGLVQLAADLASFNNIDPSVALEKLRAGMVGETEPLRTLGINITAAATTAQALKMGLIQTGEALSTTAATAARYALIMQQSGNAQGDFARTADGLANSTRIADAEFANLKAELGELLVGPYTVVVHFVATGIREINEAVGNLKFAGSQEGADERAYGKAFDRYREAIQGTAYAQEQLNAAQRVGDDLEIRMAQHGLEVAETNEAVALAAYEAAAGIEDLNLNGAAIAGWAGNATASMLGLADAIATATAEAARLSPLEQMTANAWYGGAKGGDSGSMAFYGAITANDLAQDAAEGRAARARQEAQTAASTRIANDYQAKMEAAGAAMASKIGGMLSEAQQASIGLNDQRGGMGSTKPGANGFAENIYRLQAWINDGTWAETGATFAGGDKGKAAQMIQDFQNGIFSPDVIGALDVDMLSQQVGMSLLAEKSQAAFVAAIAGKAGTDSTTAGKVLGSILGFDAKGGNTAVDTVSAKAGARVVQSLGDQLGSQDRVGEMIGFGEVLWGHFEDGIVKQARESDALKRAIWEFVAAALAGQGGGGGPPGGVGKTTTSQGVPGL